jgi:hypothetical protein
MVKLHKERERFLTVAASLQKNKYVSFRYLATQANVKRVHLIAFLSQARREGFMEKTVKFANGIVETFWCVTADVPDFNDTFAQSWNS